MTDQQREAKIAALIRERRGCEMHGKTDRVKAIDAELRNLGVKAGPPVRRAEKRADVG